MRSCYKPGNNKVGWNFIIILGYMFFTAPAFSDQDVTIYVADNFPPYSFEKEQKAQGIYVNIIREVFSRIDGYRVKIEAVPLQRAKEYLKTGRGFAMVPAYQIPRDGYIYSGALLTERIITVCTDDVFDENNRQEWPIDYQGLVVGFRRGEALNIIGDRNKPWSQRVRIAPTDKVVSSIRKLLSGRIDCYLTESLSFLFDLRVLSKEGLYDRNLAPPFTKGTDVMIREARFLYRNNSSQDRKLKNKITKIVSEMRSSGFIDDIIASYLRE